MIPTTLIALGGQTSSGKSEMAIGLAKELQDCWIINCDSRQIYKYLNLGTGKVPGNWDMIQSGNQLIHTYLYEGIPHFFIDTIDPQIQYSLAQFLSDFRDFCLSHTLPKYLILCGGTGLYIKAILEKYILDEIKPEFKDEYEKEKTSIEVLPLTDLQQIYSTFNTENTPNTSDFQNSRRLKNKILTQISKLHNWAEPIHLPEFAKSYNFAIQSDQIELSTKIKNRIVTRIDQGMIREVESLEFLGTDRLLSLGLEYRLTRLYLMGQMTYVEYIQKLSSDSINYAQKQLTWLKKQPLKWITCTQDILDNLARDQKDN
jgi:tRNA dimethylallyltransferase